MERRPVGSHLDGACQFGLTVQINNTRSSHSLLRSLPALARFLLRTNRLRSASRCPCASRSLLRIRRTRMHITLSSGSQRINAEMQIDVQQAQLRVSRGMPSHTCATFHFRALSRAIFKRPHATAVRVKS